MRCHRVLCCIAGIVLLTAATACGVRRPASQGPAVITAVDNQSQITVPAGWTARTDLHDEAELQAADPANDLYLIVLTENKSDLDLDLEAYTDVVLAALISNVESPDVSEAKHLIINGRNAIQHRVLATANKIKVTYLHTTVEGKTNYFQIVAWTLRSRFPTHEATLQQIIQSFVDLAK